MIAADEPVTMATALASLLTCVGALSLALAALIRQTAAQRQAQAIARRLEKMHAALLDLAKALKEGGERLLALLDRAEQRATHAEHQGGAKVPSDKPTPPAD